MQARCGLVNSSTGTNVPLRQIKIDAQIHGFLSHVDATLDYCNNSSEAIEATFVFPVDEDAALYRLEAKVQDVVITAECQEREQADKTYEEAKSYGNLAFKLNLHDSGDMQELTIGNIPSQCDVTIRYSYVLELRAAGDGAIEFVIPTILNPRYRLPDREQQAYSTRSAVKPKYVPPTKDGYKLIFEACISNDIPLQKVLNENETVVWHKGNDGSTCVKLSENYGYDCDVRFNIVYEPITKPMVIVARGSSTKDGLLKEDILMVNCLLYPDPDVNSVNTNNELIFFVDRSGSMAGDNMQQTKQALILFVKSLPVGCLFNIVEFDDSFSTCFEKSKTYSEETCKDAVEFVGQLEARGGTDLFTAMAHMYDNMPLVQDCPRQVFVLTDGQIDNEQELFEVIRKHNSYTRVFGFGIGEGVSTSFVKGLARYGNGRSEFASGTKARLQPKVVQCLEMALQPVMQDIVVEWKTGGIPVQSFPPAPKFLHCRVPLTLFGIMKKTAYVEIPATFDVEIGGRLGTKEIKETVGVDTVGGLEDPNQWLHRLAAKKYISQLENDSQNKAVIIVTSLSANVLSKYTAFVGVHKGIHLNDPQSVKRVAVGTLSNMMGSFGRPMMMMCRVQCPQPIRTGGSSGMAAQPTTMKQSGGGYPGAAPPTFRRLCGGGYPSKSAASPEPRSRTARAVSGHDAVDDAREGAEMELNDESGDTSGFSKSVSSLYALIELQRFDGSWTLNDGLCQALSKTRDQLQQSRPHNMDTDVWATLLALCALKEWHGAERAEWSLLANKAWEWLRGRVTDAQCLAEAERDALLAIGTNM